MTLLQTRKLLVLLASGILMAGSVAPALAQSGGSSATDSAPASASATKAQRKAERKAARKQARAKNTAELKKLESNGYQPAQNDPNYPQNLQNAQKKANAGQAASQ
ncbi:DUF4148 domain-containing protein [Paraburkholderia fungorum]|uniref:DUF4148 domain-containing protein n=1 Tax=Paraburkholderia fungorum TaxID=134537 RepID=A0A3R7ICP8_9BURK|nr:DUF4148 domain-containing protein [Paraburkholderia fungorum]RKF49882.1 hypothetical protein BCY88_17055 [Paraburkholderia fungorum]